MTRPRNGARFAVYFSSFISAFATPAGSTLTPALTLDERVVTLPSALRVVLDLLESVVDFWIGFLCPPKMAVPDINAERTAGSMLPCAAAAACGGTSVG